MVAQRSMRLPGIAATAGAGAGFVLPLGPAGAATALAALAALVGGALGRRQSLPSSSSLNQSSNGSPGTCTSAWNEPSTSSCRITAGTQWFTPSSRSTSTSSRSPSRSGLTEAAAVLGALGAFEALGAAAAAGAALAFFFAGCCFDCASDFRHLLPCCLQRGRSLSPDTTCSTTYCADSTVYSTAP
eukprot:scaffold22943_cov59-Phaeocystis_antarctica.AAC.1